MFRVFFRLRLDCCFYNIIYKLIFLFCFRIELNFIVAIDFTASNGKLPPFLIFSAEAKIHYYDHNIDEFRCNIYIFIYNVHLCPKIKVRISKDIVEI